MNGAHRYATGPEIEAILAKTEKAKPNTFSLLGADTKWKPTSRAGNELVRKLMIWTAVYYEGKPDNEGTASVQMMFGSTSGLQLDDASVLRCLAALNNLRS
jgi:hypothetical protein